MTDNSINIPHYNNDVTTQTHCQYIQNIKLYYKDSLSDAKGSTNNSAISSEYEPRRYEDDFYFLRIKTNL